MLGRLGKKQLEVAVSFMSSAMGFGGAAAVTLFYFTDWRVVCDYIPYYNGKYKGLPKPEGEEEQS